MKIFSIPFILNDMYIHLKHCIKIIQKSVNRRRNKNQFLQRIYFQLSEDQEKPSIQHKK